MFLVRRVLNNATHSNNTLLLQHRQLTREIYHINDIRGSRHSDIRLQHGMDSVHVDVGEKMGECGARSSLL